MCTSSTSAQAAAVASRHDTVRPGPGAKTSGSRITAQRPGQLWKRQPFVVVQPMRLGQRFERGQDGGART